MSGRTILRWVQKFGPALAEEVRRHRKPAGTTWLVDETYVKIQGTWHYLYRGIDSDGQVLDCWLSRTRDLAAAEAFFRRTIGSTECMPEHVVTDKATFYPSAIRAHAPGARHTATNVGEPSGELLVHRRTLDLRRGILLIEWHQRDPAGRIIRLRALRLVSLADRALGVQLVRIEVDQPVDITLEAWLEPLGAGLEPVRATSNLAVWRTARMDQRLAVAGAAAV